MRANPALGVGGRICWAANQSQHDCNLCREVRFRPAVTAGIASQSSTLDGTLISASLAEYVCRCAARFHAMRARRVTCLTVNCNGKLSCRRLRESHLA